MKIYRATRTFESMSQSGTYTSVFEGQVFTADDVSTLPPPWRTNDRQIFQENPKMFWDEILVDGDTAHSWRQDREMRTAFGNCS